MALRLFEHNEKAYHTTVRMMEQYGKVAIVHPTDKRKSYIASEMTLGEAVVRGILPTPKYVTTVYQYQKALAKYQVRVDNLRAPGIQDVNQKYLDALRRALEQEDGLDKVFEHHITNKCGKYIVFCTNKDHMDEMVSHVPEWFARVNPNVTVYEAYSDDPGTDKAFADFKTDTSDRLKLLFCIDVLNEGVRVEGISGVILFRPTISPIIYKQQIGQTLTAGDNTTPLILDVVNNFEGLTNISGLQSKMQEAVHRLYTNGEGDKIVTERFEVVEQVHDCRVPFERLDSVGMEWGNRNDAAWERGLEEAQKFREQFGNLQVPVAYASPEGYAFGKWVRRQQYAYRNPENSNAILSQERIELMDAIGMQWEKPDAWQHRYEQAQEYKRVHGNLEIPEKYKTTDGIRLSRWAYNQKRLLQSGSEKLSKEQKKNIKGVIGVLCQNFSMM